MDIFRICLTNVFVCWCVGDEHLYPFTCQIR